MLFIGLTALSMYLIYKNKNQLAFNMLKLYTNIDINLNKLLCKKSIIFQILKNNYLNQIYNIDEIDFIKTPILINYYYENTIFKQIIKDNIYELIDITDESIKNYINYKSNIISCSISIKDKLGNILYTDYDITQFINLFVLYNSEILLTNNDSPYTDLFIYLLNKELSNRNIIINNNIIIWKIILDTIDIYENEELLIKVKDGKITINIT
jgi:hypothetical protein